MKYEIATNKSGKVSGIVNERGYVFYKYTTITEMLNEAENAIANLQSENELLRKQLETITFPMELQYGDLTNYIGYGQSDTEKLVAITFGVLKEKGEYFGEEKEGETPLFIAYFDRLESLEVLEKLTNIGKARLKELQGDK